MTHLVASAALLAFGFGQAAVPAPGSEPVSICRPRAEPDSTGPRELFACHRRPRDTRSRRF
jgi:hypothetical protein